MAHDRPPNPIGNPYSASLPANRLADTGIALPAGGWIRLVGSVAAGAYFALGIPVSALLESSAGATLTNTAVFGAGGAHHISLARTSGAALLMGSVTVGGATVSAYRG